MYIRTLLSDPDVSGAPPPTAAGMYAEWSALRVG